MFRSLTVKAFFSKKPMKRIIVTFSLVIAIWLLLIAFFIYIENHKAYVISIDDLSVSFPTKIYITEPDSIEAAIRFKEYKSSNNEFWVRFPQAFQLREELFEGRDITYHLNINGNDGIHGYVQIWQLDTTMQDFLNNARKYKSQSVYDFEQKEIQLGNNIKGYKWCYSVKNQDGDIVARQSFISKPGSTKMYVITLYIQKKMYSDDFEKLYDDILYSVRLR
ncbi:MAG: hypothetical protein ACOX3J_03765 [Clostridia bacterium]|jgi:hypothetical protein